MTRAERLTALLLQVRAARGGSQAIDGAFWCIENGFDKIEIDYDPYPRFYAHGPQGSREISIGDLIPVSASVDAVLPVFSRHVPGIIDLTVGLEPQQEDVWPAATVRWYPPGRGHPNWHAEVGSAPTLPLALLATLLQAMIHAEGLQDSAASAEL